MPALQFGAGQIPWNLMAPGRLSPAHVGLPAWHDSWVRFHAPRISGGRVSIQHSPVDATQDGLFAHALVEAGVRTRALAEEGRPVPQPRARRFAARVSLHYRVRGASAWSQGITDNVSRTGVFFRTDAPRLPQPGAELELVLDTPMPSPQRRPDVVNARGAVVRVTHDPRLPEMLPGVAVAVEWRSREISRREGTTSRRDPDR